MPTPTDLHGHLESLGIEVVDHLEILERGGSAATVARVVSSGQALILKLTTDPRWLSGAATELTALRGLGGAAAPALLAGRATADAVSVLMTECGTWPTAPDSAAWLAVADALGRMHRLDPPEGLPASLKHSARSVAAAVEFWTPTVGRDRALSAARRSERTHPPHGLVHGDCHRENLVLDASGNPLWIDWQSARIGDQADDLAFLWQRAEFDGLRPPRHAMTQAWAAARGIDVESAMSALEESELRQLLVAWPGHLDLGPAEGRERLVDRFRTLTD